jgi:hypothetical protein
MEIACSVDHLVLIILETWDPPEQRKKNRGSSIRRCRRTVSSIMYELGSHAQRAHRMQSTSFGDLHRIFRPFLGVGQQYYKVDCIIEYWTTLAHAAKYKDF